jgi:hypothetical protein
MSFNIGDIVRKINHFQKYKVVEVLSNDKYKVCYEPNYAPVTLVFKGSDLELAS